jgi:hypothetical protein
MRPIEAKGHLKLKARVALGMLIVVNTAGKQAVDEDGICV